jgi:histidine triad (HIT) family protein
MACVFCEIVAGAAPAHVVAETTEIVSFMDTSPVNPGHVLTVPRRHAADIWQLDAAEFGALGSAAHGVARRVRLALDPPGLDLFMANGAAGGQTVFHAHVHIIPRWPGDGWTDPWAPTPGKPEELAAVAERIRAAES